MSIHIETITDGIFRELRGLTDEAGLRHILVDVWVDTVTDDVWGSVGDRSARIATRADIRDNLYPERGPIMMKLLVKNAKVGVP